MRSFTKLTACIILLCFLTISYATEKEALKIGKDFDLSKNPNKSIVFGKIDVKTKGVIGVRTYNAFHLMKTYNLSPQFSERKLVLVDRFNCDEYFFLGLEPGEYEIEEIGVGFGALGAIGKAAPTRGDIIRVNLGFNAIPGEVIYIGKLFVECKIKSGLPGYQSVVDKTLVISDEYEIAEKEFRNRYPNIHKDIKKSLMSTLEHLKSKKSTTFDNKEMDRADRIKAMSVLAETKDPQVVETMIALLNDKDYRIQIHAIHILGQIKDQRAVEPLIAALQDPNAIVRNDAAFVLGQMGDHRAVDPLTIVTSKDKDSRVRLTAETALNHLKDSLSEKDGEANAK